MGASDASDLARMQRDSDWYMPQFVRHALGGFQACGPKCGWNVGNLAPREPLRECQELVDRLNDMPNQREALRIALAHPWFLDKTALGWQGPYQFD